MERNAMEVVFKAVLGLSVLPTALGLQGLPTSLASAPEAFGRGATLALFLGCLISVVGICLPNRFRGLRFQQLGLTGVFAGSIFYAAALAVSAASFANAAVAFGLSFGIALGAVARYYQIGRYLASTRVRHG